MLLERVIGKIEDRRHNLLNGNINSIPIPFKRLSSVFYGIEQKKYYLVTASQKVGKTQITSFLFLYNSLLFAMNNPSKIRLKIFYFALEESPENIFLRYVSFLLNRLYMIRVSSTDLLSGNNKKPLSNEILEVIKSDKLKPYLEFFEKTVEFPSSRNPTGIRNDIKRFIEGEGKTYYKKAVIRNENGMLSEIDAFDYYEPDDPYLYTLAIVDHLSLLNNEKGLNNKQTFDKMSEYFVELRNRYGITPVVIQQQSAEMESLNAFKEMKLRPTSSGLSDTKFTSRDRPI